MKEIVGKYKTIYQDQRIAEEFCNFRCDYCEGFCPSGYSLKKDNKENLKVENEWYNKIKLLPKEVGECFKNSRKMEDFYRLSLKVMKKTKNVLTSDILKISGGEVTTYNSLVDFVDKVHKKYYLIQILTNGFNLTREEIKKYKEMKNICFQISIDGVTAESNYAKSHSSRITEKVLNNIKYMIEEGLRVEVNCVLTKYNIDNFLDFLERFKDADNFIIVPRPVRGKPKKTLNFSSTQILNFEKMINENYEKYSKILPPRKYIDRLIEIMKYDKRSTNCYIPFFVQSIDGYGNFEQCPIGLVMDVNQNIFKITKENKELLKPKIFSDNNVCENCTNQYEIFNLYVEGLITKEDLKKMPSLNSDKIVNHIEEIKNSLIMNELKKKLKEKYDLEINNIEKNEQSTDGNVYIIYSKNKKYVVKIYNNIKHTKSMIKLYNNLTENGLNVPKIILSKEKEGYIKILENNYLVLYSFLEGEQIGWNPQNGNLDSNIILAIASMLRKMHSVTCNSNNEYELPKVPFEDSGKRKAVLHFDLTRNNIFKNKENIISLIDFDDAKYGAAICDISILIANLFFSKTRGIDLEGMRKFIDEYYKDNLHLKSHEVPLIKTYALKWIDYILNGNQFDTSTTESFEIRRRLIEENL